MTARLLRSYDEVLEELRRRKEALNISHETLNSIAGFATGHSGKIFGKDELGRPLKGLGYKSLGDLMGALGVAILIVVDDEQQQRVQKRWQPRKRPMRSDTRNP